MSDALLHAVRGAVQHAVVEKATVTLVLRGDPSAGVPVRMIEGVPLRMSEARDGRERVHLRVTEDAEQLVLLERIVRVLRAGVSVTMSALTPDERPTAPEPRADPAPSVPESVKRR